MPEVDVIDVFISSTCYDLTDLRSDLADYLRSRGLQVRLSEDPGSEFFVDPSGNSIESCLANVEAASAVICIIDRRYGGVLQSGPFADLSATHAEVHHARQNNKKVFFFMREAAWNDFHALKRDPKTPTRWVEPDKPEQRQRWTAFVREVADFPKHENWSNWCDLFKTTIDLRSLVHRRLVQQFPQYAGSLASRPDRMVRVSFAFKQSDNNSISGTWRNYGVGSAIKITHGVVHQKLDSRSYRGLEAAASQLKHPGLVEGDAILDTHGHGSSYDMRSWPGPFTLYCQYANRYGDRYRVELVSPKPAGQTGANDLDEYLYVWYGENEGKWNKVE